MDPRYLHSAARERRWAEEVLHLHSLWHLGPPKNPKPNPNPVTTAALRPESAATFKKTSKKKNKKRKKNAQTPAADPAPAPSENLESEWSVGSTPLSLPESSSWGNLASSPTLKLKPPSTEELAHSVAIRVQKNAIKAFHDFFSKKEGSDDEEDDEEEDLDGEDGGEVKHYQFFIDLFERDSELREYYEKDVEKGEFYCLVCAGTGTKTWKKFVNCVALVQHAHSISNTKWKIAHRALAKVVCRVLGWDIKRMPNFVLDIGKKLGEALITGVQNEDGILKDTMRDDTNKVDHHAMQDDTENDDNHTMQDGSENDGHHKAQEDSDKDNGNAIHDGTENESYRFMQYDIGTENAMDNHWILEDTGKEDASGQQHVLGHSIEEIIEDTGRDSSSVCIEKTIVESGTVEPEVNLAQDSIDKDGSSDQQKDLVGNILQMMEGNQS